MLPDSTSNKKYYIMSAREASATTRSYKCGRGAPAIGIRFVLIFILSVVSSSSLLCMAQIFSSSSEAVTAAQTEDPLLACEPPWRRHGSKCYYTTMTESERGTLPIAKQTCKRQGGDLGKPSTYDEHIFIRRILMSYNDTWIGATDNERKNWLDGTPMLYTNFNEKDFTTATSAPAAEAASSDPSQPQSPLCSSSCCGLTTNRDGKWSYSPCDTVLNFVCVKTNETVAEYRKATAKKPKAINSDGSHNHNVPVSESEPGAPGAEGEESESGEFSEEEHEGADMESSESKVQSDAVKPEVDSGQKQKQKQKQEVNPKTAAGNPGDGDKTPNSSPSTMSSATLVVVILSMMTFSALSFGAIGTV